MATWDERVVVFGPSASPLPTQLKELAIGS